MNKWADISCRSGSFVSLEDPLVWRTQVVWCLFVPVGWTIDLGLRLPCTRSPPSALCSSKTCCSKESCRCSVRGRMGCRPRTIRASVFGKICQLSSWVLWQPRSSNEFSCDSKSRRSRVWCFHRSVSQWEEKFWCCQRGNQQVSPLWLAQAWPQKTTHWFGHWWDNQGPRCCPWCTPSWCSHELCGFPESTGGTYSCRPTQLEAVGCSGHFVEIAEPFPWAVGARTSKAPPCVQPLWLWWRCTHLGLGNTSGLPPWICTRALISSCPEKASGAQK